MRAGAVVDISVENHTAVNVDAALEPCGTFWACMGCTAFYRYRPPSARQPGRARLRIGACAGCKRRSLNLAGRQVETWYRQLDELVKTGRVTVVRPAQRRKPR